MKGEVNIISQVLRSWGNEGMERYYYDNWSRFLTEYDVAEYRQRYGIPPDDRENGIRVFFDNEGYLQVRNCDIGHIKGRIEKGMEGFYKWAVETVKLKEYSPVPLGKLAIGCAEEVRPGIYRISSSSKTVYVGHELLLGLKDYDAPYYPRADIMEADTGSKNLDIVLVQIFHEKHLQYMDYIPMLEAIEMLWKPKENDFEYVGSSHSIVQE